MAVFGENTMSEGGSEESTFNDTILIGKYKMGPFNGYGNSITAMLEVHNNEGDPPYHKYKCALYDENNTLIQFGQTTVVDDWGPNWNRKEPCTFTFNPSFKPTLLSNKWYYICIWCDSGNSENENFQFSFDPHGYGFWTNSYDYSDNGGNYPATISISFPYQSDGMLTVYCSYDEIEGESESQGHVAHHTKSYAKQVLHLYATENHLAWASNTNKNEIFIRNMEV